jgi:hypothetical protein
MKKSNYYAYQGDLREVFNNPAALLGGVIGTVAVFALLIAAILVSASLANAEEELDIDFEPGALVKLGKEYDEMQKVVTQDTRAEQDSAKNTVTEEKTPPPEKPEKKPEKEPEKPDKLPPKDSKLPTSKTPTDKNTPYDDLPTVDVNRGDPFGSSDGWADRMKDGDPWATAVMKALNGIGVGTYGAKGKEGDFSFELTVCKDGKVGNVYRKGGSVDQEIQSKVAFEVEQLQLPKPPPEVLKKMRSQCAKIRYRFRWTGGKIK